MTALRTGRLEIQIDGARASLAGRLDDACSLGELVAQLRAGDVTLDTAGIVFVNSAGMREWLRLVRALRGRGAVTLERVADVLMTQMNLILDSADRVRIASFHAQYICPRCGSESAPLIDAVAHAAQLRALAPPPMPCGECGAAMELGDFPERYLSVFRRA